MNIWHLTDHKAGHVAQARGLFAALERAGVPVRVIEISVADITKFSLFFYWISGARLGNLPPNLIKQDAPDLIVGVGHATHWSMILLKKCFPKAKSIVLMKPSFPLSWFDYAIIPAHDFADQHVIPSNIFVTHGALNPLVNEHRHEKNRHLILIGGASKRYDFSEEMLTEQVQSLLVKISNQPELQTVLLTTSRRTPDTFLSHTFFKNHTHQLQLFPVAQTPIGWLFEQLQLAEFVWVTQDSVSMLFEALTAGCHVGVLAMPKTRTDRVTEATDEYIKQGLFLPLDSFLQSEGFQNTPLLKEADVVAEWLMTKNIL
ncbi:MAG TPA: ELM1/GtrOC1 family putative glycosyltransferase [Aquirhabdus sp.]